MIDPSNKYHDDLFNSLESANGKGNMPDKISTQSKLKLFLDIKRGDPVKSFDVLDKISPLFKNCSISIVGDVNKEIFKGKNHFLNINLSYNDETYKLINNIGRTLTKKTYFNPVKKTNVYTYYRENLIYYLFNGNNLILNHEQFFNKCKEYKNIFIKMEKENYIEGYYNTIILFDNILDISEGLINPYKYPSYSLGAIDIWRKLSKIYSYSKPIEEEEAKILNLSFQGGLTYVEEKYNGYGKSYDLNSFYGSLLNCKTFQIPAAPGEKVFISKEEFKNLKYFKYGIYKVKITGNNKLFKFNKVNYYTHFDLTIAKELNLLMEIDIDNDWNFYYYKKEILIKTKDIFGQFIEKLYELKKQNKYIKKYLSSIWGALCGRISILN